MVRYPFYLLVFVFIISHLSFAKSFGQEAPVALVADFSLLSDSLIENKFLGHVYERMLWFNWKKLDDIKKELDSLREVAFTKFYHPQIEDAKARRLDRKHWYLNERSADLYQYYIWKLSDREKLIKACKTHIENFKKKEIEVLAGLVAVKMQAKVVLHKDKSLYMKNSLDITDDILLLMKQRKPFPIYNRLWQMVVNLSKEIRRY